MKIKVTYYNTPWKKKTDTYDVLRSYEVQEFLKSIKYRPWIYECMVCNILVNGMRYIEEQEIRDGDNILYMILSFDEYRFDKQFEVLYEYFLEFYRWKEARNKTRRYMCMTKGEGRMFFRRYRRRKGMKERGPNIFEDIAFFNYLTKRV